MHQLSIIRQSGRVKGDCWICSHVSPEPPLLRDRFPPHQQQWACHTLRENDYKIVEIRANNLSANVVSVFLSCD